MRHQIFINSLFAEYLARARSGGQCSTFNTAIRNDSQCRRCCRLPLKGDNELWCANERHCGGSRGKDTGQCETTCPCPARLGGTFGREQGGLGREAGRHSRRKSRAHRDIHFI